jgi:hypothetical protein
MDLLSANSPRLSKGKGRTQAAYLLRRLARKAHSFIAPPLVGPSERRPIFCPALSRAVRWIARGSLVRTSRTSARGSSVA